MGTLGDTITNARSQIDEISSTNQYWADSELITWINDGVRDVARRAEVILIFTGMLSAYAGVAKYDLPKDVIRVHRIEFIPSGSTQIYPVIGSTYDEMDQIWGINPKQQASYPTTYACWGTPGNMTVQFYPVPAADGRFNIFYYKMPGNLNTDGSDNALDIEIPAGWDDVIIMYVSYRAMMKARDPHWQIYKQEYTEQIQYMVDVTRQAHDAGRFVQTFTSSVPGWLYAFTDE